MLPGRDNPDFTSFQSGYEGNSKLRLSVALAIGNHTIIIGDLVASEANGLIVSPHISPRFSPFRETGVGQMQKCFARALCLVTLVTIACSAESQGTLNRDVHRPVRVDHNFFLSLQASPKYHKRDRLTDDSKKDIHAGRILSIPHFHGSF